MTAPAPGQADVFYREGFPEGWYMVHRADATLLIDQSGVTLFGGGSAICAAPRLCQGEAFLDMARAIAWALSGARRADNARTLASFCDHCGIGPSCDEEGMPLPTSRDVRNWTCSHCDHENIRDSGKKTT